MSKWYGKIGYAISDEMEVEPGVWVDTITEERNYYGDCTSNRWIKQTTDKVNDNINVSLNISILADQFAYDHCSSIIYVEHLNTKWKVTNVDIQHPRLILTVGGVYNEN